GRWLLIIPPTLSTPGSGHELSKLQIWRWSTQNRTYESAGEELEIQRLRGSRIINFWSPESDQVVLINVRGTNETKCAFFEVEGNSFQERVDRSRQLTDAKIVALDFASSHSGIAAVCLEPPSPARNVSLFKFNEGYFEVVPMNGKVSIRLSEGFLPNAIAFGPGNDEITLTSWNSVRILNIPDGKVTAIPPPTFRDQFMRLVVGPGDSA